MNNREHLLVISSGYPDESGSYLSHTFLKGFVEEAKHFFKKVDVVVLLPYFPVFFGISIKKFPDHLSSYVKDNVSVNYYKYPFLPIWPLSSIKGNIAFYYTKHKIFRLMQDNTVIHANFTSTAGVYANFLSKKVKKEYVLTVHEDHNWLVEEITSNNRHFIDAWLNAKVIIRVNKLDNQLLLRYNKNVISIPNGFNHRVFKELDKTNCREKIKSIKKFVIVNIGFYNSQKNQKLLIDAIELLPSAIKDNLECFIIGGGPLEKNLVKYTEDKKLNSIIKIVGQIEHDNLPIYLNASDIFCLSSQSEGNPTVMFEALGVGVPYIGTNVGGVPEIITSEKYGLLCEPNNKIALETIIRKGLETKWEKEIIKNYANQFSWKNIFLQTEKYY